MHGGDNPQSVASYSTSIHVLGHMSGYAVLMVNAACQTQPANKLPGLNRLLAPSIQVHKHAACSSSHDACSWCCHSCSVPTRHSSPSVQECPHTAPTGGLKTSTTLWPCIAAPAASASGARLAHAKELHQHTMASLMAPKECTSSGRQHLSFDATMHHTSPHVPARVYPDAFIRV